VTSNGKPYDHDDSTVRLIQICTIDERHKKRPVRVLSNCLGTFDDANHLGCRLIKQLGLECFFLHWGK
jgi:hypothetical protein